MSRIHSPGIAFRTEGFRVAVSFGIDAEFGLHAEQITMHTTGTVAAVEILNVLKYKYIG